MKDILDAAVNQFRERLSSPLMASFLISWPIWNYKFVLVFFSDMKPYVKFSYISNQVYPDLLHGFLYGLVGPFFTACFYVGLYPFIAYVSEFVSNWHRVRLEQQRIKNNDETPMSEERAKELWQEFRANTRALEKEVEEGSLRIRNYKAEAVAFEQRLAEVSKNEHELRVQLANLKLADEDSLKKYNVMVEENTGLRDALSREVALRSELSARYDALAKNNESLTSDIEKLKSASNEQSAVRAGDAKYISELKASLDIAKQEILELKRIREGLVQESSKNNKELGMLRGRVGDLESNLANAHVDLKKQKASEAKAVNEVNKITESLNLLKRRLDADKMNYASNGSDNGRSQPAADEADKLKRILESLKRGVITEKEMNEAVEIANRYESVLKDLNPIINLYNVSRQE